MSGRLAEFWHRAGETVLYLLAFALPLASYLQTYDSAQVKAATLELGVLVLVLAWFLKSVERGRFELPRRAVFLIAPALSLLAWACLGFIAAEHKAAALPGFLNQALCLATYCVVLLEFGGRENAERMTAWLLRAAWLTGLYGACQKAGLDPLPWKGAFGGRVFSTLTSPVLFSSFLSLCLPLALMRLLDLRRSAAAKAADLALSALACANVYWTFPAVGMPARLGAVETALIVWLFGAVLLAAWRARDIVREAVYPAGFVFAVAGSLVMTPGWLMWPLAGMLGGFSLLSERTDEVHVLILPWGAGRRWLYAPALALASFLGVFPVRWTNADVEQNLGVHYSKLRQWTEALSHYSLVPPGAPAYVLAQYYSGSVYLEMGKPEEALSRYAVVEAQAPDFRRLHYQKGLAYAKSWDWDKALASHERQAALDPLDAPNLRSLAQAATVKGDLPRARQAARRAIALEPREPANWQALAAVFLKEKKTVAARRILSEGRRLGLKFDKPGSNR